MAGLRLNGNFMIDRNSFRYLDTRNFYFKKYSSYRRHLAANQQPLPEIVGRRERGFGIRVLCVCV